MNTNNGYPQLPNIEELQQLANEMFSALPNEFPKEISLSPDAKEHPRASKVAEALLQTQSMGQPTVSPLADLTQIGSSGLPAVAPSMGGVGMSPSVGAYSHLAGLDQGLYLMSSPVNTDLLGLDRKFPQYDRPKTELPIDQDVVKEKEKQPQGSFSYLNSFASFLPFQYEGANFETELKTALETLNSVPFRGEANAMSIFHQPGSYYFMEEKSQRFDSGTSILNTQMAEQNVYGKTAFGFDPYLIKKDFPILNETVNGKSLIWFDNAATTQKPKSVIDRLRYFYEHENSNIHRAAHELAARASDAYEAAREKIRLFLNAASVNEIVFVRGATEGINLVAESWGNHFLSAGDQILISHLEHHANIVPWKRLADKKGLELKVIPVDDDGQIILEEYQKLLGPKTKLVAFTQVSNALGTVTPAKQLVDMAHDVGAKVLLDGAQGVSHMRVDVRYLNADWLVFSGHKLYGPTGIGVLYGKEELLNEMEPYQGGGNMIQDVSFEEIKYHRAPHRFEAGTGTIADAIGLAAAIDYISKIGMDAIGLYEHFLLEYATSLLKQIPGVRLIGTAAEKASVLSFSLLGYTNDQVGQALNKEGIAVRTGHHCAQPILRRMGVESTVRPSLAFYNTCQDVDVFIETIWSLRKSR